MKIIEVIADLRLVWLNKDGSVGFKKYKPPLRIPLVEEVTVGKEISPVPENEVLPGYYIINNYGLPQKLKEKP